MRGYRTSALALICIVACYPKWTESAKLYAFEQVRSFDDKVGSSPPLWIRPVETFADCARDCSRDTMCVSFFFNNLTGLCRAQEFLLYPINTTPDVGSEYYGYLNGNDILHELTNQMALELRIDMMDWDLTTAYAVYTTFSVASEDEYYRLEIANFRGDQGDSLSLHNGANFTTIDSHNDVSASGRNCADLFTGAWWYVSCHMSNLNGDYNNTEYGKGISWSTWKGYYESLKFVEMKVRPL